ncbi:MAG: TRAP transporter substrate-binding protein [Lachnospiraceae bacterium]|nr:TRAP transporter substrate-binding protein [Lachnospiraceae bacterium]
MSKTIQRVIAAALIIGACIFGAATNNADEQTYAWPLATCSSGETVTNIFAQKFADYVNELSGGEMRIQVYTDSTLGTDTELMETCKDGDIPFVVSSPSPQVSYMPQLCVFDTPCVYTDINLVRENFRNNEELMSMLRQIYSDHGYRFLGITDQGFRVMTMSKEYQDLSSIAGQKIRVMENKYHIQYWKSINANPTPMTFSEVYIGLQQGTIDAQENALVLIVTAKLYEQQKYLVKTNAVPDLVTLISSEKFLATLSDEQVGIITQAAEKAQNDTYAISDQKAEDAEQFLKEAGMVIATPSDEDYARMREMVEPVWKSVKEQCGDALFQAYTGSEE